jgi:large exoprotein involved in heme utilization and adhesion
MGNGGNITIKAETLCVTNEAQLLASTLGGGDALSVTITVTAPKPSKEAAVPIVPAQGWVFNGKGEVTLTAQAPSATLQIPWLTPATCHAQ